jgi:hypothetical protein
MLVTLILGEQHWSGDVAARTAFQPLPSGSKSPDAVDGLPFLINDADQTPRVRPWRGEHLELLWVV